MFVAERLKDTVKMNDLNFNKFITLIVKKLSYNDRQDMIVYECIKMINIHIINELK